MRIPSGVTDQYLYFVAVDATDFTTRETGLSSFTVYRSRNGGAAAAFTTPTVAEVSAANMPGVFTLLLDEDMSIDAGDDSQEFCVHITHAGMAPVTRTFELYRPKITAGETVTVSSGAVSSVTTTTTATNVTTISSGGISEASFATTAGSFAPLGITDQGTAQSATATTVVLRAGAAFADDVLIGSVIGVFGSTQGYWQFREITDNVLATDTVTVDAWTVTPTGTITYEVFGSPPALSTLPSVNVTQISGDSGAADNAESFFDGTGYAGTNNVIPTVTSLTNAPTAGDLTATMKASVETAVENRVVANHLDHLLAADYDPAAKPGVATALLNELVGSDAGVSQFTANSLELAPTGGSAPTAAAIRAEIDANSTQLAAIVADTNELQTDWANGGRLDLILDARASQTSVDTVDDFLDTEIVAIKAKTDQLTFTGAGRVDANVAAVNNDTAGVAAFSRAISGVVTGTVGVGSTTTSIVTSALSPTATVADQFKGRIVVFDKATTTAALRGQATDITASTTGGVLAVTALSTAAASGDIFTVQ